MSGPATRGTATSGTATRSRRAFWIAGLVVTLVVAGFVSYYASAHPDGLEWAAGESGFADTARDSAVAGSPLADYGVEGVDDGRLSGGLAGVIGVAVTLVLAGGLTLVLRRRTGTADRD
ncbi:PDGLE domain-containing protein [Geodermatophilus sp. FMUSA9-8]|uniref:PDGLE domain-containing protein n=1 Tax=Geodermatophilus sp. FMUSA9-8 TaxID=3120155 RepID=UPI00300AB18C